MTVSVAPNQISYRIGEDDGTWSGHTWEEAKNTGAAWYVGTSGRVRIPVDPPKAANRSPALRLQVKIKSTGSWNSLPVTEASASDTTGSFWIYNSANETQGSTITATACGSTPSTWQNGLPGYHDTLNPGAAQSNIRAEYTELEWSLKCLASARTQATYFFRMTDDGTVFTTYTRLADIKTLATAAPSTSSFTALTQAATLKEETFATLNQAATTKESAFQPLAQSAGFVESFFATLAQTAAFAGASFASFSVLAQAAAFAQSEFATLAQSAAFNESGFSTLNQSGSLKSDAFTVLEHAASVVESAFSTLAQSGSFKEAASAALNQMASIKSDSFTTLEQRATMGEVSAAALAQSASLHSQGFTALASIQQFEGAPEPPSGKKWKRHIRILHLPKGLRFIPKIPKGSGEQ